MRKTPHVPSTWDEKQLSVQSLRLQKEGNWDLQDPISYVSGKKPKSRAALPLTFDVADLDVLGVRQCGDVDLGTRCLLQKTHITALLANQTADQVLPGVKRR
jgi:hypothetical protein